MLTKPTVMIILKYIHISNQYAVYLNPDNTIRQLHFNKTGKIISKTQRTPSDSCTAFVPSMESRISFWTIISISWMLCGRIAFNFILSLTKSLFLLFKMLVILQVFGTYVEGL